MKNAIAMLQDPEFDSKEIESECFDLQEGPADGDQDLNLWIHELEDVVLEIMEDPIFKGHQNFHLEMEVDEIGACKA